MEGVFKLAEKVKYNTICDIKDYKDGHVTIDFMNGCIASSDMILDFISGIWDVDLTEYYVGYVEE